jgi:hypothetical protein
MATDTELLETAWGQPIDPRDQFDADWDWPRRNGLAGFATGRLEDRAGGKNRPVYETEGDLEAMRAAADVLCETSTAAIGALKNLTNFVIGSGFVYSASPRQKQDKDKQLVGAVQVVIDEFLEANDWCGDRERELFGISRRYGESLLSITDDGGGHASIRNIAAARVKEPRILPEYGRSTTFGVETTADDLEQPLGYWVQWDSLDGQLEFTEAVNVEHIKINVDRGIKRGVSDFFAVETDFEAARTLLKAMVKGGAVQASIAYIVEHAPGITQGQIENLRTQNATLKYDQTTPANGTQTHYQQRLKPGQRLDVGKGQQYKGSPLASGEAANAYVTILQAGLRSIGSRWCMPEYMISGDASNANYSSTMVAESPFVRNCEVEQAFYKRKFLRVVWAAVRIAADAGRFGGRPFDEVKRLVEIQVDCQPVAARNALQETQRNKLLKESGVLSDKTFAGREGLDHEQEQANITSQPKPEVPAMLLPVEDRTSQPSTSPALESAIITFRESLTELRQLVISNNKPGDQAALIESAIASIGGKQRGNSPIAAALESVRTTEEARAILLDSQPESLFAEIVEKIDHMQMESDAGRQATLHESEEINAALSDAINNLAASIAKQSDKEIVIPAPVVKIDMRPVENAVKALTGAVEADIASRNFDIVRVDPATGQEVTYKRVASK